MTADKRQHELNGQLWALRQLANDVRLDCKRNGRHMEAGAIQMMQDALRQIRRMETD